MQHIVNNSDFETSQVIVYSKKKNQMTIPVLEYLFILKSINYA